jgi:hypothetical protein
MSLRLDSELLNNAIYFDALYTKANNVLMMQTTHWKFRFSWVGCGQNLVREIFM